MKIKLIFKQDLPNLSNISFLREKTLITTRKDPIITGKYFVITRKHFVFMVKNLETYENLFLYLLKNQLFELIIPLKDILKDSRKLRDFLPQKRNY